jgi:preprotein translocase subunit SecD
MSRLVSVSLRAAVLTAVISVAGIAQPAPPTPASPPILELRLASATPAPGFSVRRDQESGDQPTVLYLASDNVVSDADLVRARARPAPDGIVVEIQLSDVAAARLREIAANNIGKYMAVFGQGRLAGSATIMAPIPRGNRVTVGLTLPAAAADSLRSRIAARWPEPR